MYLLEAKHLVAVAVLRLLGIHRVYLLEAKHLVAVAVLVVVAFDVNYRKKEKEHQNPQKLKN